MYTINSMTSSSNNNSEKLVTILRGFLEGNISLDQLGVFLKGYMKIDFSDAPGLKMITDIKINADIYIPVKVNHVCQMLQKYISGDISETELSNWATIIYSMTFFQPEGDTEEERFVAGEGPVWVILQKLTAPTIFDGLDRSIAKQYINLICMDS